MKSSKFKNVHQRKSHEGNKRSEALLTTTNHHCRHCHDSSCRPSPSMPDELWHDAIGSDRDVWVERSCLGRILHDPKSRATKRQPAAARRVVYYYSLRTGQCKLFEPPTGASWVLLESEQDNLSQNAQEWLKNEMKQAPETSLSAMKRPKPSLNVAKKRKTSFFGPRMKP